MSEAYQILAQVYDRLQQAHDVAAWAGFIHRLNMRHGRADRSGDGRNGSPLLLDLGCGTGRFCLAMEQLGYDPIGIDLSAAMLQQARDRAVAESSQALFIQQDISRFELFGTVDLMVCLLDTVNHLLRQDQVRRLFRLSANYLNPGCLFVLDIATRHHLETTLGNGFFFQDLPAGQDSPAVSLFWQNHWTAARHLSQSDLVLFSQLEDGNYQRLDTEIRERWYDGNQLKAWAADAGLEAVGHYGELHLSPPRPKDERQFLVFRRSV